MKRVEALVLLKRWSDVLEGSQALLARLNENEEDVLAAMLQRLRALGLAGAGKMNEAVVAINDAVDRATVAQADYELAQSLSVRSNMIQPRDPSRSADSVRAGALLKRLGAVHDVNNN